jgi:hypothetical protein
MSDNDLIRRGDALRIMSDGDDIVGPDYPEWFINRYAAINAIPAVQPTVSPDVAALVEAAEKVRDSYWYSSDGIITGMHDLETALARVKGEIK